MPRAPTQKAVEKGMQKGFFSLRGSLFVFIFLTLFHPSNHI
jgi:hypothetical protein